MAVARGRAAAGGRCVVGRHPLRDERRLALGLDAREERLRLGERAAGPAPVVGPRSRRLPRGRAGAGSPSAASGIAGAIISAAQRSGSQQSAQTFRAAPLAGLRVLGERPRLRASMCRWRPRTSSRSASSAPDGLKLVPAPCSTSRVLAAAKVAPRPTRVSGARQRRADELVRHRDRAVEQVAEVVAQVRLVALEQRLVGEVAVAAERVLAQHEVAQRIDARARRRSRSGRRASPASTSRSSGPSRSGSRGRRSPWAAAGPPTPASRASRRRGSAGCPSR